MSFCVEEMTVFHGVDFGFDKGGVSLLRRSGLFTYNGRLIGNNQEYIAVEKDDVVHYLQAALQQKTVNDLKNQIRALKTALETGKITTSEDQGLVLKRKTLEDDLQQILEARSLERAQYYTKRLQRGLFEVKTNEVNDINLNCWKEYDDVFTDSLWVIDRRDSSGSHLAWYWGNFIPQIPHQLMLRYTNQGDVVVDPFAGSGTTLIECRRLGRHGAGVEISSETVAKARECVEAQPNPFAVQTRLVVGDSRVYDFGVLIKEMGFDGVDLYLMHPPYHDIIQFTSDKRDLSNAKSTESFLKMFGDVLDNTLPLLKKGCYAGVVIGDKYYQGEWIPLGFYCMQEVMQRGLKLKSIVVKNFEETKGKRNQKELWRYRALAGGFYVFKHEYILIFEKP